MDSKLTPRIRVRNALLGHVQANELAPELIRCLHRALRAVGADRANCAPSIDITDELVKALHYASGLEFIAKRDATLVEELKAEGAYPYGENKPQTKAGEPSEDEQTELKSGLQLREGAA